MNVICSSAAFSKICCRCGAEYKVNVNGSCVRKEECSFHWGRLRRHKGAFALFIRRASPSVSQSAPQPSLPFPSASHSLSFIYFYLLLSVSSLPSCWRLGDQLQLLCCSCGRSRLPNGQGTLKRKHYITGQHTPHLHVLILRVFNTTL